MNNFETKESYSHKFSKNILKEWFNNGLYLYSLESDKEKEKEISNRINEADILFEYPLAFVPKIWEGNACTSFDCGAGWGYLLNKGFSDDPMLYVPNYDECINAGYNVIAIIDLVVVYKGRIIFGIEICNKNPVSIEKQKKINKLYNKTYYKNGNHCAGVPIFEIDSNWIIQQINQPKKIIFKRQII